MEFAADDMFDQAIHEEEMRDCLRSACNCSGWHWHQNDEGFYECSVCGEEVDL